MSFNFAPQGWSQCNGQLLMINQNQALFSLLGTTYGGNGQTDFALPDLRGLVAMHTDHGVHPQGQRGGETAHVVTLNELATHLHDVTAMATGGTTNAPAGNRLAIAGNLYASAANLAPLVAASVSTIGGSQAHENRQPFLALSFCMATTTGIFPQS